jgi:hypothetical protein
LFPYINLSSRFKNSHFLAVFETLHSFVKTGDELGIKVLDSIIIGKDECWNWLEKK